MLVTIQKRNVLSILVGSWEDQDFRWRAKAPEIIQANGWSSVHPIFWMVHTDDKVRLSLSTSCCEVSEV